MSTPPNPMERLPELPSEIDPTAAGLWAASILFQAALTRGWDREKLRFLTFTLVVGVAVGDLTDAELHAEFQTAIDAARSHGAVKQ
ncbi:hypothetical protein [Polaromonas sp. JS666]|uniref:hypothetical protein n=1 Tax=Polaromonas sp. (strain JS666 / ATCC BAA-500) TaxID=296591 RepID=UPI0000463F10|nr:hypothetical protein [Polaromonas sp. JS666]ABE44886.1 hypothetical protein Bpro_2972 [Polaromonas sp. JS666]